MFFTATELILLGTAHTFMLMLSRLTEKVLMNV